ncbi:hypothetical protein RD792_008826 [Penstemon davidsonii]|uniref:Beta-glucosidase n=1 Tax=Penstemon davidsonii TaxID=160366 RepID=A0ABR0DBU1_9LAMI|nr:hypothetical protein RD792_008826 [Penstemon davidsonii]
MGIPVRSGSVRFGSIREVTPLMQNLNSFYFYNLVYEIYYVYMMDAGVEPFVTMFHFDTPQALEDAYGGFLSSQIVVDFEEYAELLFREFGDRVKYWITVNEPWCLGKFGYANGIFAPGRCSEWMGRNCIGGDSATEPYIVIHNQLLAHATVAKLYRTKYQASLFSYTN